MWKNSSGSEAQPVPIGTTLEIGIADVRLPASDREIENPLPDDHVFDPSAACAVIATMVERQRDGVPGDLAANTYSNCCTRRISSSICIGVRSCGAGASASGAAVKWRSGATEAAFLFQQSRDERGTPRIL
jgi:hypothetical protein